MFVIWGKKAVYRRVGYVADFCSICRAPRPFLVRRVGSAGHVYYISFGQGELVGFERTCEECKTTYRADTRTYKTVSKTLAPLATLKNETFPNLSEVWKERLAIEEKVKNGASQLSAEERKALIRDPFVLLSPKVEKRYASTHIDKEVGFSILGAIALLVVGPGVTRAVLPDQAELSLLVFMLIGIGLVVWQIAISGRRYLRREILPVLGKALKPLRPTQAELNAVLAELKQLKHKIGVKLNAVEVDAYLRSSATA